MRFSGRLDDSTCHPLERAGILPRLPGGPPCSEAHSRRRLTDSRRSSFWLDQPSINTTDAGAKRRRVISRKLPPAGLVARRHLGRTTQRPRHPRTTEAPNRYPISFELRYQAKSKLGLVQGFGQNIMISNQHHLCLGRWTQAAHECRDRACLALSSGPPDPTATNARGDYHKYSGRCC
jgi:hypothetical protein